jgi:hypothetical protein
MNAILRHARSRAAFLFLLAALFAGFSLTACAANGDSTFASGTWRYKMTVMVSTPEGDKVGSAVREVAVQKGWSPLPEMQPHVSVKGQAVVIDLGERGILFALLRGNRLGSDYGSDLPAHIFMPEGGGLSAAGIKKMSELKAGPTVLAPEWYPAFVRFKDPNDPRTVESVSRYSDRDFPNGYGGTAIALEKAFGSGVRLKSITLEMTKEPVTSGISTLLPWLTHRDGVQGYIGGSSTPPFEDATKTFLTVGDFIRGTK